MPYTSYGTLPHPVENTPLVSAIILNYGNPQYTVNCAKNLQKQTIANRLQIIVIDNHSEDDSIGILRNQLQDIPNIHIVETPDNLGFGGGNNYASRYTTGEYILILNPDTQPEPSALEHLIHVLEEDKSIGIIAPKLIFSNGIIRDSYRTFPTILDIIIKRSFLKYIFIKRLRRYLQHDSDPIHVHNTDWVVGAFMLMHKKLFDQLHGFDERYFLFFEDADLCRRCWNAGKRVVYYPTVKAADGKERLSGDDLFSIFTKKTGRIHLISALKYFWKWHGKPLPVIET